MNGVHDMGGMQGMGPVQAEVNEPVFHERWEARVYVLTRAIGAWKKWNIEPSSRPLVLGRLRSSRRAFTAPKMRANFSLGRESTWTRLPRRSTANS